MRPLLVLPFLLAGCVELGAALGGRTPHEEYAQSLSAAGLGGTALVAAWQAAAEGALAAPVEAEVPFEEVAFFDPARPEAAGYRLALRRGQQLRVRAARDGADSTRLFLDLFRLPADSAGTPVRVGGADRSQALGQADTLAFVFESERDGRYVLRLQPELLRGGRVRLVVEVGPSLGFPVAGRGSEAIRSVFGDPRDGGARRHEGVDVFAPRGTPAVAAADGVVSRVGEGGLGGRVVWLAVRGYSLYYAHLDSQLVASGTRVQQGDTLGLVGNTGNAQGTEPHLHFGVYARFAGAVDPYPFVHAPPDGPAPVRADTAGLGRWARLTTRASLGAAEGEAPEVLPAGTALRPVGALGSCYRAVLPDGTTGYVEAGGVSSTPLCARRLDVGRALRLGPSADAPAADSLGAGTPVDVIGRSGEALLVASEGRQGWVAADGLACDG